MEPIVRRKPVTLTVPEDIIVAAKDLALNVSQAAETGIRQAVRDEQARRWLTENARAIADYNADIERRGVAIPPSWAQS